MLTGETKASSRSFTNMNSWTHLFGSTMVSLLLATYIIHISVMMDQEIAEFICTSMDVDKQPIVGKWAGTKSSMAAGSRMQLPMT
jgi:hypothetical protein